MRLHRTLLLISLLAGSTVLGWAADITGRWDADYRTSDGGVGRNSFVFRQDGEQLTGTITDSLGDVPIQEGKVSGDVVSFVAVRTIGRRQVKLTYTGSISGNEIKFRVVFEGVTRPMQMVATREQ